MIRKVLLAGCLVLLTGVMLSSSSDAKDQPADAAGKRLRHVVMFQFKDSSSKSDVQGVVDAFNALPSQIPEIADYEFGVNNSPENLNDGLTHCFLVTFKSEEDRAAYLPHKAHLAFVDVLKPHLEKVVVIDFWTK